MFHKAYRLPFRLIGIPIDLDISFLLVLPLFAWIIANNIPTYLQTFGLQIDPQVLQQGAHPFLLGVVAALGLFASVVVHELGHCVVGRRFGMEITSITLWLLGGMAQFKEISKRPGDEARMAIAGPLTSYALGVLFWILLWLTPESLPSLCFVVSYLMWMNVILATFNLVPALPLDGGRVLRSLLALRMSHVDATEAAATVSRGFAFLLGLAGFVSFNVFLMLVALFIFMAGGAESRLATVSAVLRGIRVRDLMTRAVSSVPPGMPVPVLLEKMFTEKHLAFPVLDEVGRSIGIVTLRDLQHPGKAETKDGSPNVETVMSRKLGVIGPDESAFDAFLKIGETPSGRLVVVGSDGQLDGILSKTDLVQAIQLRMVGKELSRRSKGAP